MVSNPFFFSSIFFNTKFSPKLHYAEQVRCARTIVSSNLQGLSPQRVHSKGILSPKSSHKCYFSTIHPLAMKGQTLLFTFQSRIQSVRRFGAISFGVLAQYHSAFWRNIVRRFGVFRDLSSTPKPLSRAMANYGSRGRPSSQYGGKTPHDGEGNAA